MKTFFQIWVYEDLQELIDELKSQIIDWDNTEDIIVCIAKNNPENIKTIKDMF